MFCAPGDSKHHYQEEFRTLFLSVWIPGYQLSFVKFSFSLFAFRSTLFFLEVLKRLLNQQEPGAAIIAKQVKIVC